jgi:hypothetical protein
MQQVLPVITVVNLVQNPTVTYLKLFGDRLIYMYHWHKQIKVSKRHMKSSNLMTPWNRNLSILLLMS